jgi:asparagine synthase (glutamine-hydrolysing)
LSRRIVDGPKSGFGLPLGDWFRGAEFASLVRRMRDPAHPAAAHFDARVLQTAIADHQAGRVDHGELLWLVANVFLWSEPLAAASEPAVLAPAVSG